MPIKCSIVIRCFNEEKYIGKLLDGILKQSETDYEILIVDSGSTDATVSIASRYPVKILSIDPDRFSFGRALNFGCETAKGEFIVIVSAHVYPVYEDWLHKILEPFENPEVALVYGKQRGNEVTKFSEHQVFAKWFPNTSNFNQKYPFCNNANAAIRRSLWQERHYDEDLTGLEDLEWAKKAISNGFCIAYTSKAEIIHVHDESYQGIFNRYRREAIAFKQIYPEQTLSILGFLRLMTANIISDYFHAIAEKVLLRNILTIPIFRLMQFWGTYKGFCQKGIVSKKLKQTFYYPRRIVYSNSNLQQIISSPERSERFGKFIDYNHPIKEASVDKI